MKPERKQTHFLPQHPSPKDVSLMQYQEEGKKTVMRIWNARIEDEK